MKKEKSCGAVVIRRSADGCEILLIQHNKGHWSFPKGHVEGNETEEETAKREIREETGLDVGIDRGFRHSVVYSPEADTVKEVVYFVALCDGGQTKPQPEEIQKCEWLSPEKAKDIITFENDRKLFDAALEYITKNYSRP